MPVAFASEHDRRWVVASDHAALEMKNRLADHLRRRGFDVDDLGPHDPTPVDYPDFAGPAARGVAAGRWRAGLLLCGTGLGMSYAANRIAGVRAALCWSAETASLARMHNDANMLVLPGRAATLDSPEAILDAFLDAAWSGDDRHARRVAKIEPRAPGPDASRQPLDAVAIDGPAGAGKSTVARALARALGWRYLDTGAMYRAVTLKAMRDGLDLDDAQALGVIARDSRIDFDASGERVFLDGEDVSSAIRGPDVTARVRHAAHADPVRSVLRARQRRIATECPAVLEGRDIATVVLPGARWKFFLTASPAERARRRAAELRASGHAVHEDELRAQIESRDASDFSVGPLKEARDRALLGDGIEKVDTTGLPVDEVVRGLLARVQDCLK